MATLRHERRESGFKSMPTGSADLGGVPELSWGVHSLPGHPWLCGQDQTCVPLPPAAPGGDSGCLTACLPMMEPLRGAGEGDMGWGRGVQREQLTPPECWGRRWQSSQAGQSRGMGAGWGHKGLGQEGPGCI